MHKTKTLYGRGVCKKCYYAFANRRQLAFLIDSVLWYVLFLLLLVIIPGPTSEENADGLWFMSLFIFCLKDGFAGYSPGKALLGLRVIIEENGNPIDVGRSFKRNIPILIPFMLLIVAFQLCKGHRTGDGWSHAKVIWTRFASHPIFLPKSSPEFVMTDAQAGGAERSEAGGGDG